MSVINSRVSQKKTSVAMNDPVYVSHYHAVNSVRVVLSKISGVEVSPLVVVGDHEYRTIFGGASLPASVHVTTVMGSGIGPEQFLVKDQVMTCIQVKTLEGVRFTSIDLIPSKVSFGYANLFDEADRAARQKAIGEALIDMGIISESGAPATEESRIARIRKKKQYSLFKGPQVKSGPDGQSLDYSANKPKKSEENCNVMCYDAINKQHRAKVDAEKTAKYGKGRVVDSEVITVEKPEISFTDMPNETKRSS